MLSITASPNNKSELSQSPPNPRTIADQHLLKVLDESYLISFESRLITFLKSKHFFIDSPPVFSI